MKPIIINEGGIEIVLPIAIFPTKSKKLNNVAANEFMRMIKKALKEFAITVQEKFPHKEWEYEQILVRAMKKKQ